jgi:hypothetical protein
MSDPSSPVRAARFLEQVLLWNILIHVAALASLGLLLLPGLPTGPPLEGSGLATFPGTAPIELRMQYIAEHPWRWRLGWLPWHLAALIDVITGIALVCTPWIPRLPAVLTLLVTLCAVVPEQIGEITWAAHGGELATEALGTGNLDLYLALEEWAFHLTAVVGASIYLLMALGWTLCFVAAGTWSRLLSVMSLLAWGCLAIGSAGLLLPEGLRPGPMLVAISNGLGFVLLIVWLILVTEQVLRRARPDAPHGRLAPWRHPWPGPFGRLLDLIANSRVVRAFAEWAPVPAFRSDITDVIYVNYLVEAERLAEFVPLGLELQRIGPDHRYALFTFLTYKHGHFGPALLGPLRKLMPSPVHSNWRTYVRDPRTGRIGIYFVINAIASTPPALGARLFSEGMPMHALARGAVKDKADGTFEVVLDPGEGSGVQAAAWLRPGVRSLPPPFSECWDSYEAFLAYAVRQDRAFSTQPWYARITRQEIELGIPLEVCEPLQGEVVSRSAEGYVGNAALVCFRVPSVAFRFDREEHEPLPEPRRS